MEHLVFEAVSPRDAASAYHANTLKADWQNVDGLMDFVPPKTHWLDFDHDEMPLGKLTAYFRVAGFTEQPLWNANFRDSHAAFSGLPNVEIGQRVASLFQASLYYGMLESVVGRKTQVSYLMRREPDGRGYLYSRNLHFCLQTLVFDVRMNPQKKFRVNEDIQLDLRYTHRWISRFAVWSHPSFRSKLDKEFPGLMDQLEGTIPAIVRLAESIERTRIYALPDFPTMGTLAWDLPFDLLEMRRLSLRDKGWCRFKIKLLEDTVNQSTIDWIAALDIHQESAGHESCTAEACIRNNIDESTYVQKHVCQSGECPKLLPDLRKVLEILRQDKIPTMRFEEVDGRQKIVVDSIFRSASESYIAISHVWADGLGGATEHGLNTCLVNRLANVCGSLNPSGSIRFWIDSLCIPRTDREVYRKALDGIKDVYSNATAVLVLDQDIQQCTVSSSVEILYTHIYLSAWMQRMWTYEEAIMSKELVFALKDGFHTYNVETCPSMRRTVCVVWQSLAAQLYRLKVDRQLLNIGHVSRALRYRLANKPQDEFLSVSAMLSLDTNALFDLEADERVKHFWVMLRWIPSNVPFMVGPKLSQPGFRWAPRTLMSQSNTGIDTESGGTKSECTSRGLVSVYLNLCLDTLLKGSVSGPESILYVCVNESDGSVHQPNESHALLRLYCSDTWVDGADCERCFDTVMFQSETKTIMSAGSMVPGAAFKRSGEDRSNDQAFSGAPGAPYDTYRYIGRLLVERLNNELASESRTLTFGGFSKTTIAARGTWIVKKVCVT